MVLTFRRNEYSHRSTGGSKGYPLLNDDDREVYKVDTFNRSNQDGPLQESYHQATIHEHHLIINDGSLYQNMKSISAMNHYAAAVIQKAFRGYKTRYILWTYGGIFYNSKGSFSLSSYNRLCYHTATLL